MIVHLKEVSIVKYDIDVLIIFEINISINLFEKKKTLLNIRDSSVRTRLKLAKEISKNLPAVNLQG